MSATHAEEVRKHRVVELVRKFANVMIAAEDQRTVLAADFNDHFDVFLADYPNESIGTFARQISQCAPGEGDSERYQTVFSDLVRVRAIVA